MLAYNAYKILYVCRVLVAEIEDSILLYFVSKDIMIKSRLKISTCTHALIGSEAASRRDFSPKLPVELFPSMRIVVK